MKVGSKMKTHWTVDPGPLVYREEKVYRLCL